MSYKHSGRVDFFEKVKPPIWPWLLVGTILGIVIFG
jgi:hypothetical protein